ncbi:hypothetical protein [Streptomyces lavenduligriseus]|uniref:Uncharacterized protein n=1 Tax=Streptomyces lavenduligriseus TaxID=67315 RepID=A0ABT0P5N2_9ACTN|nr:hypothetical protein [Streptomyces lavenduligriseus]MCL3999047.1 hypothetical protein [Streptomyces lavenduligriseus]
MEIRSALRTELDNFIASRNAVINTITREFRGGTSARALANSVTQAFSRDQVVQYLGAVALHDSARSALKRAGLDAVADTRVTGIDAPREARLNIAVDPAETPDYADLPGRIRAALRDSHLTLALTHGFPTEEDTRITDDFIDEVLLDGEPVRIVKAKPAT